jgi:hypothetical protein
VDESNSERLLNIKYFFFSIILKNDFASYLLILGVIVLLTTTLLLSLEKSDVSLIFAPMTLTLLSLVE